MLNMLGNLTKAAVAAVGVATGGDLVDSALGGLTGDVISNVLGDD